MMFYSVIPLIEYGKKINCPFVAAIGGKGNGKTFSAILYALKQYFEYGYICRYLRRYDKTITTKNIQSLCNPHRQDIINLSHGKYNGCRYWHNRFYMCKYDNEGNVTDKCKKPFMIASALNSVEMSTGADEGEISCIIYDEVLSREKELKDEFNSLMIFHSNCIRNRTDRYIPLIMLGNTFTRKSMLLSDFGVNLYNLKRNEITVIRNGKTPLLCVEYCDTTDLMSNAGDTYYSRFDNDRIKMIYQGNWTISNYPHCSQQLINNSDLIYTVHCLSPSKKMLQIDVMLYDDKKPFLYVHLVTVDSVFDYRIIYNKTGVLSQNESNYLPNRGIFKQIQNMIFTKNCYFESNEIGEMFRDFLQSIVNGQKLAEVYK